MVNKKLDESIYKDKVEVPNIIDQKEEDKKFPLALVLAVVTFPLWIGLVALVGGTVFGVAASIIGSAVGLAIAGFSLMITAYTVGGFSGGLLLTGIGFILLAVTVLLLILFVAFCGTVLPWLAHCIRKIIKKILDEQEETA